RDGNRLFAAGGRDGSVRCWLTEDYRELEPIPGHSRAVHALDRHPREDLLAAGSADGSISLWNTRTGEPAGVLVQHTGEVFDVRFSPDGKWMASAGGDQTIVLWSTLDWRVAEVLNGHTGSVRVLRFSSDGKRLASGGEDGKLRIWNVARPPAEGWAETFRAYHNDGMRFTAQSRAVTDDLGSPLNPPRLPVPADSWLGRRKADGGSAADRLFREALQAENHEAAAGFLTPRRGEDPSRAAARVAEFCGTVAGRMRPGLGTLPLPGAVEILSMAERAAPGNAEVRGTRALLTLQSGDAVGGVAALDVLLQDREPGRPMEWWDARFQALLDLGNFDKARGLWAALPGGGERGSPAEKHYPIFAAAWHRSLPVGDTAADASVIRELRGLALLEYLRRAASLVPYDTTMLDALVAEIAAWRARVTPPVPLIAEGAAWHFLDDGTDPGAGWAEVDSAEDAWPTGGAPLGAAVTWKQTTLRRNLSGDIKQPSIMSFYFRHAFAKPELGERRNLWVTSQYDDGIVLYLNGAEIRRINMAEGPVNPSTPASEYQNKPGTDQFQLPASLLKERNVLAAEVHQREPTSTDIYFDATLAAVPATAENWLADLKEEERREALEWCGSFLPSALADAWVPVLKFACADGAGALPAGTEPAMAWLIRARLQTNRNRPEAVREALAACRTAVEAAPSESALHRDIAALAAELPEP
ncbi:MAG: repeat-containing protein, partial [Verrucomicrobiales bacterium]|nr:repeat-containing protein [Verrucomicrobiales bacterium]